MGTCAQGICTQVPNPITLSTTLTCTLALPRGFGRDEQAVNPRQHRTVAVAGVGIKRRACGGQGGQRMCLAPTLGRQPRVQLCLWILAASTDSGAVHVQQCRCELRPAASCKRPWAVDLCARRARHTLHTCPPTLPLPENTDATAWRLTLLRQATARCSFHPSSPPHFPHTLLS